MAENEKLKGKIPINFREVDFVFNGDNVTIAGMARPDHSGTIIEESMQYIKEHSYDILIGLHPQTDYALGAKEKGVDYKSINIKDFSAPGLRNFENVYQIIQHAHKQGKNVAIHCGLGFGRTGTVLAALKLKELVSNLSDSELIQQPTSDSFEMGAHDRFAVLQCTPMIKQAILYVRRGDEKDDSVENTLQINSLNRYQSYLINVRRRQKLQNMEVLEDSPSKNLLIKAQQQWFQQADLRAQHRMYLYGDDRDNNVFSDLEKLNNRYLLIVSMSEKLQSYSGFMSEKESCFYENLVKDYQALKEDVITDIDNVSKKHLLKQITKEQINSLLKMPISVLSVFSIYNELNILKNSKVTLLDNLNQLILKMESKKDNTNLEDAILNNADQGIAVKHFLIIYKTISDNDKSLLPLDLVEQIKKLSMAIISDDMNSEQNLIKLRRAELIKAIAGNEEVLSHIKIDVYLHEKELLLLEDKLLVAAKQSTDAISSIAERIKTKIIWSHLLEKFSLKGKLSSIEREELLNNSFEINSTKDFLLLINELPEESWQDFINQNITWLNDKVFNSPNELSKVINNFDSRQNNVLMECVNEFLEYPDNKLDLYIALLEGIEASENKSIVLGRMIDEILKISDARELMYLLITLDDEQRVFVLKLFDENYSSVIKDIRDYKQIIGLINDEHKPLLIDKFIDKFSIMISQGYELIEVLDDMSEIQQAQLIKSMGGGFKSKLDSNSFSQVITCLKSQTLKLEVMSLVNSSISDLITDNIQLNIILPELDEEHQKVVIDAVLINFEEMFDDLYGFSATLTLVDMPLVSHIANSVENHLDSIINSLDNLSEVLNELDESRQLMFINTASNFILRLVNDNGGVKALEGIFTEVQIGFIQQAMNSREEKLREAENSHLLIGQLLNSVIDISQKNEEKIEERKEENNNSGADISKSVSAEDFLFFSTNTKDEDKAEELDKENSAKIINLDLQKK